MGTWLLFDDSGVSMFKNKKEAHKRYMRYSLSERKYDVVWIEPLENW